MADDYYEVLEVPKSSTQEEIQKAYRKLARKYHPDLHAEKSDSEKANAKQRFQKIQQAYDVLNDAEKREMYDRFGPNGPNFDNPGGAPAGDPFQAGNPFGGAEIDFSQIFGGPDGPGGTGPNRGGRQRSGFENLFRQFGGMGGSGMGGSPPQHSDRGQDVEQEITVSFHTAIVGGEHQISLQRRDGKVETIKIRIPAGVEDRKKIRLRGQGEVGMPGGTRGDLLLRIRVAPHPAYSRSGSNLKVTVPITLKEAVFGAKIDLPTPIGKVTVSVPKGTTNGKTLRLKGLGIKSKNRTGDLMVQLHIQIPEKISADDIELINRLSHAWNDPDVRIGLKW